jgi:hypothetical protein
MLTIKFKSETDLVALITAIGIDAREFRFWDHYCTINSGEYGKNQRDIYKNKVDKALKNMGLTSAQRLATIIEILQTKSL